MGKRTGCALTQSTGGAGVARQRAMCCYAPVCIKTLIAEPPLLNMARTSSCVRAETGVSLTEMILSPTLWRKD